MKNKLKISISTLMCCLFTLLSLSLVSCGNNTIASDNNSSYIDLTAMSSTMVYSQVADMINNPDNYKGKIVKAKGTCSVYTDQSTQKTYYAVIIKDALACCSQGLEFELENGNYPIKGKDIIVEGMFGTYNEGKYTYCQLSDAKLI